jgi:hypothetical protein
MADDAPPEPSPAHRASHLADVYVVAGAVLFLVGLVVAVGGVVSKYVGTAAIVGGVTAVVVGAGLLAAGVDLDEQATDGTEG